MLSRRFILLIVAAAACSPHHQADPGYTVSDSAGVTIVINDRPALPEGSWTFGADPVLILDGNNPGYPLTRVETGARLGDGRYALLISSPEQVVLADRDGGLVRRIGGSGEGPGEFTRPTHLAVTAGDTIRIWDSWFGPGYAFDTLGRIVGEDHVDLQRFMAVLGSNWASENRTMVPWGGFVTGAVLRGERRQRCGESLLRSRGVYFDSSYGTLDLPGSYPMAPWGCVQRGDQIVYVRPTFFAPSKTVFDVERKTMAISRGDIYQLDVRDRTGNLLLQFRKSGLPVLLEDSLYRKVRAHIDTLPTDMQAAYSQMADPRYYPPVLDLKWDVAGYYWVRENQTQWAIFDREGRWVTTVHPPVRWILEIGSDYLLGVRVDQDDVPHVVEYSLRRARH